MAAAAGPTGHRHEFIFSVARSKLDTEQQLYAIAQDPNSTQLQRDLALSVIMKRRYDDQAHYISTARTNAPALFDNPPEHLRDRVTGQLFVFPMAHDCGEEQHVLNESTAKRGEVCPISGKPISEEPFIATSTQEIVYHYVLERAKTTKSTASLKPILRSPWERPSIQETFHKIQRASIKLEMLAKSPKLSNAQRIEAASKICNRLLPYKAELSMYKVYGYHYQILTNDFQLTAPWGAFTWGEDRFLEPVGSSHDLTIEQQLGARIKAMKMFLVAYLQENPEFFHEREEYKNTHIRPTLLNIHNSYPEIFTQFFGKSFVEHFLKSQ